MSDDRPRTLFHPFESGVLASPAKGERVLFLGAEPGFRLPDDFDAELHLAQGFRPHYRSLAAAGYRVKPRVEGKDYDAALVLCGRHRGRNEAMISDAVERVRPGGMIVVAGSAADGIASLRKRLEKLVGLEGSLPKYHGVAFWLRRPDEPAAMRLALSAHNEPTLVEGRFVTAPGMFSHDRVDAGSRLLAENLPDRCDGAAADFGAGWGYLSAMLAERTAELKSIDLYEAGYDALEAAKSSLAGRGGAPTFDFHWHDLAGEQVAGSYDLIVMNPPFHQGRAAEPEMGRAFIRAASGALRRGGRLFMVANRGLPYDQALKAGFSDVTEICRDGGFRVIVARR